MPRSGGRPAVDALVLEERRPGSQRVVALRSDRRDPHRPVRLGRPEPRLDRIAGGRAIQPEARDLGRSSLHSDEHVAKQLLATAVATQLLEKVEHPVPELLALAHAFILERRVGEALNEGVFFGAAVQKKALVEEK